MRVVCVRVCVSWNWSHESCHSLNFSNELHSNAHPPCKIERWIERKRYAKHRHESDKQIDRGRERKGANMNVLVMLVITKQPFKAENKLPFVFYKQENLICPRFSSEISGSFDLEISINSYRLNKNKGDNEIGPRDKITRAVQIRMFAVRERYI